MTDRMTRSSYNTVFFLTCPSMQFSAVLCKLLKIHSRYIDRHRYEHAHLWRYEGRDVSEPSVLPSGRVPWCRVHRKERGFIQCRPSCHGGCLPGMACSSAHAYHGRAFRNSSLGTG